MPDLQFNNAGSVVTCQPLTEDGYEWLRDHLTGEVTIVAGAVVIECRYLADIVLGARAAGLVCEG